jgi:hypothetical protein
MDIPAYGSGAMQIAANKAMARVIKEINMIAKRVEISPEIMSPLSRFFAIHVFM